MTTDKECFRLYEIRNKTTWYVAKLKGKGGVDWEWTTDPEKAAKVTRYQARRFLKDRLACGIRSAAYDYLGRGLYKRILIED